MTTDTARCGCGRPLEYSTALVCVECRAHGGIPLAITTLPQSSVTVSYRYGTSTTPGDGTIAGGRR